MNIKDEYYTPKWLFDQLAIQFDMDVCSPGFPDCQTPTKHHVIYPFEDGLQIKWSGNVWCNPPYSKPKPWIDKFIEHNFGIMLVILSKSNATARLWENAHGIRLLPPNIKFIHQNKPAQIQFQTALFAFGKYNLMALDRLEYGKTR